MFDGSSTCKKRGGGGPAAGKDKTNKTAMHWAFSSGTVGILSKLLAVPGVLMNNKAKSGTTPIAEAIMSRNPDTLQFMTTVEEVDLDVRDFSGMSLEAYW